MASRLCSTRDTEHDTQHHMQTEGQTEETMMTNTTPREKSEDNGKEMGRKQAQTDKDDH